MNARNLKHIPHSPEILKTTMVLTSNQITALFKDAAQMGLSICTRDEFLQLEVIVSVYDMAEWEYEDWDNWCSNFKKPDQVPDLTSSDT